jgi:hypothetical protein
MNKVLVTQPKATQQQVIALAFAWLQVDQVQQT